jgi:hypothetical protein
MSARQFNWKEAAQLIGGIALVALIQAGLLLPERPGLHRELDHYGDLRSRLRRGRRRNKHKVVGEEAGTTTDGGPRVRRRIGHRCLNCAVVTTMTHPDFSSYNHPSPWNGLASIGAIGTSDWGNGSPPLILPRSFKPGQRAS